MSGGGEISAATGGEESLFVTAPDGLALHVRCYGSRLADAPPIVCLPGLSRTSADFEALARALTRDGARPRRVLALDYRGRGDSGHDPNPENYSLAVELADVLAVLTALAVAPAVFVGTSRGGILTMLLAAMRPTALAGVVLNDIGPVIETKGLMRIKGYVGKLPQPRSFEDGAEILRRLFSAQFPRLTQDDWLGFSKRSWREHKSRLVPRYDVNLARTLANLDPDYTPPPLWKEFGALAHVPLMVIRGANSDILSAATIAAMQARRPDLEFVEVADQGHAPLIADGDTIARIKDFISRRGDTTRH